MSGRCRSARRIDSAWMSGCRRSTRWPSEARSLVHRSRTARLTSGSSRLPTPPARRRRSDRCMPGLDRLRSMPCPSGRTCRAVLRRTVWPLTIDGMHEVNVPRFFVLTVGQRHDRSGVVGCPGPILFAGPTDDVGCSEARRGPPAARPERAARTPLRGRDQFDVDPPVNEFGIVLTSTAGPAVRVSHCAAGSWRAPPCGCIRRPDQWSRCRRRPVETLVDCRLSSRSPAMGEVGGHVVSQTGSPDPTGVLLYN